MHTTGAPSSATLRRRRRSSTHCVCSAAGSSVRKLATSCGLLSSAMSSSDPNASASWSAIQPAERDEGDVGSLGLHLVACRGERGPQFLAEPASVLPTIAGEALPLATTPRTGERERLGDRRSWHNDVRAIAFSHVAGEPYSCRLLVRWRSSIAVTRSLVRMRDRPASTVRFAALSA